MGIFRIVRSVNLGSIPAYAMDAAQHGIDVARRDIRSWASLVDFVMHPVDVNLTLDNGDIELKRPQKQS